MADQDESQPKPEPTPAQLLEFMAAGFQQLGQRLDNMDERLDGVDRKFERVAVDVNIMQEQRRRQGGLPPHREPVRPETETSGDGFSSYPWLRKPATPRLS